MASERGKNAIALTAFLVVGALLVFGAWRLTGSSAVIRDCSFNPETWTDARQAEDPADRYDEMEPMAEDIVKCDDLGYGKSPPEVRALLGSADSTVSVPRTWHYDIGIPPPNSDYPGLAIQYSRDGSVSIAEIPGFIER